MAMPLFAQDAEFSTLLFGLEFSLELLRPLGTVTRRFAFKFFIDVAPFGLRVKG
jgi:hypothetical protein